MNQSIIMLGKLIGQISASIGKGAGGTWPGEIALRMNSHILHDLVPRLKKGIILVAGTNGKTTTSLMIKQILEKEGSRVIHNGSGANLLNGVVSSVIQSADWLGRIKGDWGVFEVDENSLPIVIKELENYSSSEARSSQTVASNNKKFVVVLLNLFRDQLDRYGEVDVIAEKWQKVLRTLPTGSTVIANADDPLMAHLGMSFERTIYFGIDDPKQFLKQKEHATDSTFCLNCGARLSYKGIYFSHLGIWECKKCGEKRPIPVISNVTSPLAGQYNQYNTMAAVSVGKALSIPENNTKNSLKEFKPAFGRQEIFSVNGKQVRIFLSKNPTGFNASLRTVLELGAKQLLLVLNDRIPDGRDISWIWDVDFEMIPDQAAIIISGDRTYDMALRIKYALKVQSSKFKVSDKAKSRFAGQNENAKFKIDANLAHAVHAAINSLPRNETLYILATYSAMLEVRKILTGKKIL